MTKSEIALLPCVTLSNDVVYKHESEEEWLFACWCRDLIALGAIEYAGRPDPAFVSNEMNFTYGIIKSNKHKYVDKTLVKDGYYEGDMQILWSPEWEGVFHLNQGTRVISNPMFNTKYTKTNHLFYCMEADESWIDVKGTGKNPKHAGLSRSQQLMANQGIYVQKAVPKGIKGIFRNTFAPIEALLTPKLRQRAKGMSTLSEYLTTVIPITTQIPMGLELWRQQNSSSK